MNYFILFVLVIFAGSLVACMVLSACILSEIADKRTYRKPEGQEGGSGLDYGHHEREGKASDHHGL